MSFLKEAAKAVRLRKFSNRILSLPALPFRKARFRLKQHLLKPGMLSEFGILPTPSVLVREESKSHDPLRIHRA
jgi:hypothetical protein